MERSGKHASHKLPKTVGPPDVSQPQKLLMERQGLGSIGHKILLLTNHFLVSLTRTEDYFFHYSVSISYEDGKPVNAKGVGRRILGKVHETYGSELAGKSFAYDGEKSLFTIGSLPQNKLEFTVVLYDHPSYRGATGGSPEVNASPSTGESKRSRVQGRSKKYKVAISYAAKIPLQAISNAIRGRESAHSQAAVRVLDIILRQHAFEQNCLLVRQSFFHNQSYNFADLGYGVVGCRGFHSSFRATQGGLSLNIDVSTTLIVKQGPVTDFLLENQNVRHPDQIDWVKAKRILKNLRIKTAHSGLEQKITGLSEKICKNQTFSFKPRKGNGGETQTVELTVHEYFVGHRKIPLQYSGNYPCINVGKPNRPTFVPIELCSLVPLQRYTKSLSNQQKAMLVEKSRQKPRERMTILTDALGTSNYNANPLLGHCGITIDNHFTPVEGRVLPTPKLKVGNGEDFHPRNGRWNFNNRTLVQPMKIDRWAVVNFSARCDVRHLCRELVRCGQLKGMNISPPSCTILEDPRFSRDPANVRVDEMYKALYKTLEEQLQEDPQFLLCILPEKKNSYIYGPWKRRSLSEEKAGIVTQCIAPARINDQYLTNVLLKINAKMGGINSLLTLEHSRSMPVISKTPTLIVGMDVSHGSPGRDVPSIAAVVSSRGWPQFSRYRAVVHTQSPRTEMIDSLYKKVPGSKDDEGIFRELLLDFYRSCNGIKPQQIIIFRDGVSESQFDQVLNNELNQIIEACKLLDEKWYPKFTVIVAQKNHHTKFFQRNSPDNVPPGTVIDNQISHPKNNDFYMCAHAGMIGTTRPTHYHVLYDQIHFSADQLQQIVHSLSYVYQRSTTAISVVAPICYAHLAASQMSQFIKFDELSEASSSQAGVASTPELPKLGENVRNTMFFC